MRRNKTERAGLNVGYSTVSYYRTFRRFLRIVLELISSLISKVLISILISLSSMCFPFVVSNPFSLLLKPLLLTPGSFFVATITPIALWIGFREYIVKTYGVSALVWRTDNFGELWGSSEFRVAVASQDCVM